MVKYAHAHPEKKYRSITLKAILLSTKTQFCSNLTRSRVRTLISWRNSSCIVAIHSSRRCMSSTA